MGIDHKDIVDLKAISKNDISFQIDDFYTIFDDIIKSLEIKIAELG